VTPEDIRERIIDARLRRNLTQEEVSKLMGSRDRGQLVQRIESKSYCGWSVRTLLRLADALDCHLVINFKPKEAK
jgi:transcriptional regulator with XRE-family HTH domain